ncbi:Phosphoglucosamine mutase [hydrothermal vent metagenome]|uniref:Phosphoglucosamine mutase n=1 Tax=hydrothermal vent metagenome TaxID=652676 RepID=A0A1W1C2P7_9ZZZZ
MKLFGTDGVRGEAGTFLTAHLAMRIAMAAAIYFKDEAKTNKILVGKDTRRSGYMLENAIVSGLTAIGYDVIQIGPMPTPAVAFLTEDMRCDAGIMISASHNPYEDNGIKFFDARGDKLPQEVEEKIEKIYFDEDLIESSQGVCKSIGKAKRIDDVIGRYIVHLKNSFPRELSLCSMRIVLDAANGAGYKVGPTVLEELGAEVIVINDKPDGFNINDNCGAIHTDELCKTVITYRADLGIALDGDADRVVIVDECGEVVDGDQLIGALAKYLFDRGALKGNGIVTTVMSNQALDDYLSSFNVKLYRSSVGDKNVLEVMKKEGLNFGGEQSGHVIMLDFAKTGDGLATALAVLAYLVDTKQKASKALRPFELYPQKLVNLKVQEKKPFETIEGIGEITKELEQKGMRHLIRYSGTENKLRLLLEGRDAKLLNESMEKLVEFFKKALGA